MWYWCSHIKWWIEMTNGMGNGIIKHWLLVFEPIVKLKQTWSCHTGRLGHGDIEEEGKAMPLRVETMSMLRWANLTCQCGAQPGVRFNTFWSLVSSIHVVSVSCGAEHTIALCQEGVRNMHNFMIYVLSSLPLTHGIASGSWAIVY